MGEAILPAGVLDGPPACLRVGVTQLDPRANGRFCLGELQPRVYCRDEAARRPSLDQARRELYRSPRGR